MGAPLDIVKRKTIVSRKLAGESLLDISISMCIPYSSILAIWKRYKVGGLAHLAADYSACGKGNSLRYSSLKPFCLQVKQEHPRWGAARLLLEVEKAFLTVKLPQVRTLQQWYKEVGLNRPLSKKGKIPTRMATSVHSIWQVDAKENIDLGKQYACYLTIVDQNSGAGLDSIVFPL